jgi:hypothetical protein
VNTYSKFNLNQFLTDRFDFSCHEIMSRDLGKLKSSKDVEFLGFQISFEVIKGLFRSSWRTVTKFFHRPIDFVYLVIR